MTTDLDYSELDNYIYHQFSSTGQTSEFQSSLSFSDSIIQMNNMLKTNEFNLANEALKDDHHTDFLLCHFTSFPLPILSCF